MIDRENANQLYKNVLHSWSFALLYLNPSFETLLFHFEVQNPTQINKSKVTLACTNFIPNNPNTAFLARNSIQKMPQISDAIYFFIFIQEKHFK